MTIASIEHIVIDEKGLARIAGTRMRVSQIASDHVHQSWSAEAILKQHPHLTLGQIHSALAYYYDHRDAIDRELDDIDRAESDRRATHVSKLDRPDVRAKLDELRDLLRVEE